MSCRRLLATVLVSLPPFASRGANDAQTLSSSRVGVYDHDRRRAARRRGSAVLPATEPDFGRYDADPGRAAGWSAAQRLGTRIERNVAVVDRQQWQRFVDPVQREH